jgi:hypothetical protein
MGEGELELCLPSPKDGRGAGGEGKDLSLHWDAPLLYSTSRRSKRLFEKYWAIGNLYYTNSRPTLQTNTKSIKGF